MQGIYAVYGSDGKAMALQVLRKMDAASAIPRNARIAIKPNMVLAKPPESGATTHPQVVEGIIEYLWENGFTNIEIIESAWAGGNTLAAYKATGFTGLSSRTGVPLYDLKKDKAVRIESHGMELKVCSRAMEADFLINVPVLKAHCQTLYTGALKNLKGIIPDSEKRRYHTLGIHEPVAKLAAAVKQHLVVVDGLCGDLTFEEGGNPVEMNRLIAGSDALQVDSYCASLIGVHPDEVGYLALSRQLGIGEYYQPGQTPLTELNRPEYASGRPASRKAERLAEYIVEEQACCCCYGSLIHALNRLDESGRLSNLKQPLHIGQGNRGKTSPGIGVGACCSG